MPATFLLAGLAVAIIGQGAFYFPHRALAAALLLAGALTGSGRCGPAVRVRAAAVVLGAAGILWASGAAGEWGAGVHEALGLAAVVAALELAQRAGSDPEQRRSVETAVIALAIGSAALGWVGAVAHVGTIAEPAAGLWRAAGTLTYSNALGALAAVVLPLAVGRARVPGRVADRLAVFALLVGLLATLSRGAVIAGLVALAVLYLRDRVTVPLDVAVAAGVAAGGSLPALAERDAASVVLAVAALGAGVVLVLAASRGARIRRAVGALGGVLAAAGLVASLAGLAAADRLNVESADRLDELAAARSSIAAHPWLGTGPGDRTLELDDGRVAEFVHNEYVQLVVDYGLLGTALIVGAAALASTTVRRRRLDGTAVGALGALAAAGTLDFTWHILAIPIVAATIVGLRSATRSPAPG